MIQHHLDTGIPSARLNDVLYHPHFNGDNWECDCYHYKKYKTHCRHILIKINEQKTKYAGGVRDSSITSFYELLDNPDKINNTYIKILSLLQKKEVPLTDREIAKHLNYSDPNKIRPRRNELSDPKCFYHPLIMETGQKRRCTISNKLVYVWELTEYGRLFLKKYNE